MPYDMGKFYEINPYDDEEISQEDLLKLIPACKYILANSLLPDYKEQNEGYQMLSELITIAQEALQRNKGLVSIGD